MAMQVAVALLEVIFLALTKTDEAKCLFVQTVLNVEILLAGIFQYCCFMFKIFKKEKLQKFFQDIKAYSFYK